MVPVRKPGRPLSACPHPRDRPCSCGRVTAAIPKKQSCRCGDSTSNTAPTDPIPQDSDTLPAEPTSPSRATFKIQKASARPHPSRKQSFDITNFERMDMNNVNIVQFEHRSTSAMPIMYPNGYGITGTPQEYGFVPQYANFQPQDYKLPMQPPPHVTGNISPRMNGPGGDIHQGVLDHSFAQLINLTNGVINGTNGATSSTPATPTEATNGDTKVPTNGSSCCATKPPTHSHSSSSASSISEPQEPGGDCCSSKRPPLAIKVEPMSNDSIPMNTAPQASHQVLLEDGTPFNAIFYPHYIPQGGVFTYPSTYGSFNNPLDPSAWKQSARANGHMPPDVQNSMASNVKTFVPPSDVETKDTVHTCHCGDTCQCIGCAAHPYNDATQNYVRSAYSSMAAEAPSNELHAKVSSSNGSGSMEANGGQSMETIASPKANTPSSSPSMNGEEQNLSAADFFFVNYSFPECGGDTESCPCGDDCKCLGCTIHNWPTKPPTE